MMGILSTIHSHQQFAKQVTAFIPQRRVVAVGSLEGPPRQIPVVIANETNAITATKARLDPSDGRTISGISKMFGITLTGSEANTTTLIGSCHRSLLAKQFQPRSLSL